ncbi:MAG TPA: M48 family metallopeptidase [Anaerolineaceae bacterium]
MNSLTEQVVLDPERQRQAKIYARLQRRLEMVDLAVGGIYALAWLGFGWGIALRARLESLTSSPWLLAPLFAAVFGAIYTLIDLPLSYYSGFVLPHRFGQSTETLRGWITDQLKGLAVSLPLGLVLLEVVFYLLRAAPDTWWLWAAAVLLVFQVLLANLAPVLLMPLFNKFVPLGEEHADLAERLIRLAQRANTRVKGVYKFDMSRRTRSANAALTGLGSTRRIILGDTLINEFTPDEIETVLAHELGHQVHKDIPTGIAVGTVVTLVGLFLASLGLRLGVRWFGLAGPADPAALPLLGLVLGLYSLVTMPLGNAYSRWRESRADEYALQATGNGPAYAAALTRLANQNLADAEPEAWVEFLFYSHPALARRIAMAQGKNGRG